MRTPHFARDFFRWRWAPSVALIAASFAFVALVLLFIPAAPGGAAQRTAFGSALTTDDARAASLPRAAFNASVPRERASATQLDPDEGQHAATAAPAAVLTAPAAVLAAPASVAPAALRPPDFSANIADRGDRPRAPVR